MQIVDRRLNPGGKSLENRQKFLRRAKALMQRAVKKSSETKDIRDVLEGGEVEIPLDGLNEPSFQRGSRSRDMVLPGNKQFSEGDHIPRPPEEGGGRPNAPGEGDSEDAFRFVLTREEFLDFFLDDLELPDLAKRSLTETEAEGIRRAGYTTSGSPANISVSRTVRIAMARRVALGRPRPDEIEALEAEMAEAEGERRAELAKEIETLKSKLRRIPYLDPIDIRYRRFETEPRPVTQAVMFCMMDVSGSMSEHMKDLAKRFYMLLYVFLTRRYKRVDIVFIRHTDRAEEVDEETFFRGPASGGTLVSSALEAMVEIVKTRYRPSEWNIYAAQASDGDNPHSDGERTASLLTQSILPVTQYFAYLEVGEEVESFAMPNSTLWTLYEQLQAQGAELAIRKVNNRNEIYPIFRDLFQRRAAPQKVSA